MRYRHRKFKSIVINGYALKNIFFGILVFLIFVFCIFSIDTSKISVGFLKYSIADTVNVLPEQDIFLSSIKSIFDFKNILLDAVPFASFANSDIFENEIGEADKAQAAAKQKNDKCENSQIVSENLSIKNETSYNIDVQSILAEKPHFKTDGDKPLVLIVHTHASESFTSNGEFETSDTDRTLDTKYNMVRIGNEFENKLRENNIGVIHDKTIHDYPSYTSSYKRTLQTIESYLEKYPSIQMVFDVHRDAITKEDGTKIKLTTKIGNKDCAQVMIVCGSNDSGLEFDGWEDNLRFAMQIQNTMETDYPTLARPLNISKNRYNMHKTRGSLIFEIGTNGNTLDEAINGAGYMADCVVKTVKNLTQ